MTIIARLLGWSLMSSGVIWLTAYWWFVPNDMRPAVPFAHPPLWLRIVFILAAIGGFIRGVQTSELLSRALPDRLALPAYRINRTIAFVASTCALLGAARLFGPLFGLHAASPSFTIAVFLVFVVETSTRTLNRGLGLRGPKVNSGGADGEIERRLIGPSAEEMMANDPRPPILYLRSFDEEAERGKSFGGRPGRDLFNPRGNYFYAFYAEPYAAADARERRNIKKLLGSNRSDQDEQMLFATFLSRAGPYIAIGRPSEVFRDMDIGATKMYVSDDRWQAVVIDMIEKSAAIVLEASHSNGLLWEIEQVIRRVSPRHLLLILPPSDSGYSSFKEIAGHFFPKGLPEKRVPSRLLMFAADWAPVELDNPNASVADALEPFCVRNGIEEAYVYKDRDIIPVLQVIAQPSERHGPGGSTSVFRARFSGELEKTFQSALDLAYRRGDLEIRPEHLLLALLSSREVEPLLAACHVRVGPLRAALLDRIDPPPSFVENRGACTPQPSTNFERILQHTVTSASRSGADIITGYFVFASLAWQEDLSAAKLLAEHGASKRDILAYWERRGSEQKAEANSADGLATVVPMPSRSRH